MSACPYPVHLCQPDAGKSCGACCGLYNYQDHSRAYLGDLLQKRTALYASFGDRFDREEYRQREAAFETSPKLLEAICNCEFLGFLDAEKKRVGCLLHPSQNRGEELRYHSYYGPALCANHFCPSYAHLAEAEQRAVAAALDDWYLYGLVVTDIDLVKEFFRHAQDRLGDSLNPGRMGEGAVKESARAFFRLKEDWPFAAKENRLGKYFFSIAEYRIARIEYEKRWKIKPSRFDRILVSLSSDFDSLAEVRRAEEIVEEKIRDFVRAWRRPGSGSL
jgi:hypothetical protein